ncbi:uncharacterized protein EKO05_0008613 [Ascochyta rabiei]|uniref:uncharacterized protein n=1 Tax=Didymella rabiei TaxID=5454 RepID=UPI0021FE0DD2|nr:uncharacterized protein EKO05_0008613 [Ascochyta rabiei]UPX18310.1 hypothetical protein EKO05_0008613 [Ascochyta rabiei]
MTTVVANSPIPVQHVAPAAADGSALSRTYAAIAPSTLSPHIVTPTSKHSKLPDHNASPTSSSSDAAMQQQRAEGKRSPLSSRGPPAPRIVVKKEPASPDMPTTTTTRHRPRRLDLSNHNIVHSSGALTARPSGPGSANVMDMGLACLSPGFHTQDPTMRSQLQRSLDVRERQRQIIEARQKNGAKGASVDEEPPRNTEVGAFGRPIKTPHTSRRKGPPPGLSIAPPAHQTFANDRIIQSAPINQTFTGLRSNAQLVNGPSGLSQTSHIHHVPAQQTNNRLPPISDVFPEPLHTARNHFSPGHSSHSNQQPPLPSPGFAAPHSVPPPLTSRPREYKSAEEAVQSLSGGREDLLPRLVHYGGHQPPTPPSPMPKNGQSAYPPHADLHRSGSSRRRGRDEYERDAGTPPLGRQAPRIGPFGEGRDSPETQQKKKEEFIGLCARAWDLFHS